MIAIAALLLATPTPAEVGNAAALTVTITGLRNKRGAVLICLTRNRSHFPNCSHDPAALSRTVAASTRTIEFPQIVLGTYAIAVFHDENDNGKLDTFMGIPREGFGFSCNPKLGFGAPQFDKVNIKIVPGLSRATVHIQYVL